MATTLSELLAVEDDLDLLEACTADGVPLWSLVRNHVLSSARFEVEGIGNPRAGAGKPRRSQLIGFARRGLTAMARRPSRADVLLVSSTASVELDGASYVNRLTDPLYDVAPTQSVVWERADAFRHKAPRTIDRAYASDVLYLAPLLWSRVASPSRRDRQLASDFALLVRERLPHTFRDGDFWSALERRLAREAHASSIQLAMVRRAMARVAPRLVLIEDACHGKMGAILALAARERGARTAEYQHGLISPEHQAYNFGDAVAESAYRRCLPDDFLYYGSFWERNSAIPARSVILGNPWLTRLRAGASEQRANGAQDGSRVLVLSAAHEPARLISVALGLVDAVGSGSVVLRPHPLERPTARDRYGELLSKGVALDEGPLYSSIAASEVVVGEISTALFEALAFDVPTYCLSGGAADHHNVERVLPEVDTPAQLLEMGWGTTDAHREIANDLWADGWEQRYRDYLSGVLASS